MVSKARHSRRGQAALEYLLTHGWALLVLALAIVILYGIGIFNPNRYVAEECIFQPGFGCASPARLHLAAPSLNAKYVFGVPFSNNLGYDIAITKIEVTSTDFITGGTYKCSITLAPSDISESVKHSLDGCIDWYMVDWNGASYELKYPALLLNGQTKNFNLVFKHPTGLPDAQLSVGESRELKFKITYKNCNTALPPTDSLPITPPPYYGWPRGTVTSGPLYDWSTLYTNCVMADTSEHVLAGKIVSRVGTQISTLYVTQNT